MSNERINEHIIEAQMKTIGDQTGNRDFPPGNRHLAYGLVVQELIDELKRCYEEIDNLVKEKNRLIDIAERCGAWEGNFDFSDINDEYGACNICGSIPSGCCEASE